MDLALADKRALVTGSTGGIGEGIAKTLAREGAAVVVQGRNKSAGRRVQQQIEAAGGKAVVAIGDLSTDDGVPVENSARVRNRFPDRAQFRRMHASTRPRSRRADVHSSTA